MTFLLKDPRTRHPKVEAFLAKQGDGAAAAAGRWLVDLVRATVPTAQEDVYHQMPTWAVKDGVGFAHVSVYSKHASLGFTRGARLDDKDGLFEPSTSHTYRAVKLSAPGAVPKAKLVRLLKQAVRVAQAESPRVQATSKPKPRTRAKAKASDKPDAGGAEVDDHMAALRHPLKASVQAMRKAILAVDPRIVEQVKWNAPSFRTDVGYLCTFNLRDPAIRLVFHNPLIPRVQSELLDGEWKDRRIARFPDAKAAKAATPEVQRIVAALLKEMDA